MFEITEGEGLLMQGGTHENLAESISAKAALRFSSRA